MKIILISLVFNGLDLITGIVGAIKNGEQIKSEVNRTVVNEGPKVGRNDLCPCGSGKKYKNCCGKNQ